MPTPEQFRAEEDQSIERERAAFDRRQKAFLAVHRQFAPFGNGVISSGTMDELDAAEKEWREATAAMDRIAAEIRSGTRR